MKKLIATAAASVLALATISAGEGLKVSGFIRGGLSDDITDSVADADHSGKDDVVIGKTWVNGDHWGGVSRGRLTVNYDGDNGGVCFRFQPNLADGKDYFTNDNVKYAMAYANFFDSAVIVEGGKLTDRFTAAVDDKGMAFDGSMGVRLVVKPIDGLAIALQGSDYNPAYYNYEEKYITENSRYYDEKKARRQGNEKFDANLFSLSAAYTTDAFAFAAGAHFSGIFYGSFAYTGVENLSVSAGFVAHYAKWNKATEYTGDAKKAYDNLLLDFALEYDADPVLFGFVTYFWNADDAWFSKEGQDFSLTLNPYVQYKLSDITALRAESTLYVPHSYDNDALTKDMYCTVTPSVVFNASEKADVNVWLQISSDTDQTHHSTGVGVRYNF
jgi:hypothetical protein